MSGKYLLIPYFISSFLFSNQYLELDISNFYESSLDNPCITFDPTYTTAYYLNNYNLRSLYLVSQNLKFQPLK
mgnify:CR=1 FL=1